MKTDTAIAHNFVLTVARRDDEIWVGTEKGLSLGLPATHSVEVNGEHDHLGGK